MEKEPINIETSINNDNEISKTKKVPKILFIVGIVLILCLLVGAFILGKKFANKEQEKDNNKTEEKVNIETSYDKEKYKYNIYLYQTADGYYCKDKDDYCSKKATAIPSTTKNAVVADYIQSQNEEPRYILYFDKTYKIYDVKEDKIQETPIEEQKTTRLHSDKDFTEIYGFVYSDENDNYAYYNLTTKKEMYKGQYNNLTTLSGKYIEGFKTYNEGEAEEDNETFLLSISEEKVEMKTFGVCKYYNVYDYSTGSYIIESEGCFSEGASTIYTNTKKVIAENKISVEWSLDDNGNLYILSNNKVEKYNTDGKLLSTSKSYSNVLQLIKEFVVYVKDNELFITDGTKDTKLGEWKDEYYYHSALSGYYDEGSLINENEKDAGIYLIIELNGSNEGPGIEYYYNTKTQETKTFELEYIGGYAKPILYLYPEKQTDITINFEKEENLTTTYPKFKEEWKVTAHPNGDIYDKDNKYYYGLYWEENANHKVDFKEGFYVSKENAISFLEEKLSTIGLNAKEKNEFIMYWLPILEKNEHNLVYFELTEERESFNKIEISPKPDSLLRMAIHVKKVDGPQTIKEQEITSFKRTGFTAVEWGGVIY